jgi:RimJ/RimL family protein N-acetyltransferase
MKAGTIDRVETERMVLERIELAQAPDHLRLLRDRETGEMVGRGGLQYTFTAGLNDVEAGWAIVPERWGQGLATELAHACVEVGFGQLDLFEIIAFTQPTNLASRRVMEKAGFEYDRDILHAGLPHVLYRSRR